MKAVFAMLALLIAAPAVAAPGPKKGSCEYNLQKAEDYINKMSRWQRSVAATMRQTNSQLRRIKNETKQTKILSHKAETKTEREKRIEQEAALRSESTQAAMVGKVAGGVGSVLGLILSLFGFGAWRNMSAKEKLRKIIHIADETWSAVEAQSNKKAMTSEEKAKAGEKAAAEMSKLPHLKVKGDVDWKTLHTARSVKKG